MAKCYIGFGSNVGEREKNISSAIELLKDKCEVLKTSSFYETEPMYFKDQDNFLNTCVLIETDLDARDLLVFLKEIEGKLGRKKTIQNGPRIIDLDILFYGGKIISETLNINENLTDLIIPHPKIGERRFVLVPLNEIAADFVHPVLKLKIKELLENTKDFSKVTKI